MSALNIDQKVVLFRRLFLGRTNVYTVRWKNRPARRAMHLPASDDVCHVLAVDFDNAERQAQVFFSTSLRVGGPSTLWRASLMGRRP